MTEMGFVNAIYSYSTAFYSYTAIWLRFQPGQNRT